MIIYHKIEAKIYDLKLIRFLFLHLSDELPQFGEDVDVLKSKLSSRIASKTRDEWMSIFDSNPDACVMPILELVKKHFSIENIKLKILVS
jgi:hypothetical protein